MPLDAKALREAYASRSPEQLVQGARRKMEDAQILLVAAGYGEGQTATCARQAQRQLASSLHHLGKVGTSNGDGARRG